MAEKVGYLGVNTLQGPDKTTFGYLAAEKFFSGQDVEFVNFEDHRKICMAVAQKKIKFGVVAIENVIAGVVTETIYSIRDAQTRGGLHVCGEVVVPIELYFMGKSEVRGTFTKILSHPHALSQCGRFIEKIKDEKRIHIEGEEQPKEGVEVISVKSTGEAAYQASAGADKGLAAICSKKAKDVYQLDLLDEGNIADNKNNITRFWILGKEHADRIDGKNKTAILINLRQEEAGVLWRALGCFSATQIGDIDYRLKGESLRPNLLLMYPIPISGKHWEYTFLLEYAGHLDDDAIRDGLDAFAQSGLSWFSAIFLGSYPSAT